MGKTVAVVGGGIVGLATAYKLLLRKWSYDVIVLEKEAEVAQHQSTKNSGVLHAGLHYAPGSLKARLARLGLREMVDFCVAHGVAHEQCGKVVVATDNAERARLEKLAERGTANGLVGLRWLDQGALRELEPHAGGRWGLHVPEEGIVDFRAVCLALRSEIIRLGGEVRLSSCVREIRRERGGWNIATHDASLTASILVNCAGLHADRVARMAGLRPSVRIVPFRGEYWILRAERTHLVRSLIYPVPDPSFPFLGVHFTRMIAGGVEAGPNAVIALAREGYSWLTINPRDVASAFLYTGLWRFLARYPGVAAYEVARSLIPAIFVRSLRKLVPEIRRDDLYRGQSGVRAQVMNQVGDVVTDFVIEQDVDAIHVLSAPSPAATASLAIASHIVDTLN